MTMPVRWSQAGSHRPDHPSLRCKSTFDAKVDFSHLKAGRFETEVKVEHRQILQLFGEKPIVPDRILGQAVVRDHESLRLSSVRCSSGS